MTKITDQNYLRKEQYKDESKLETRMNIHEKYSTNQYGFHKWVFDQYNFPEKARVLEVDCGTGLLWQKNRSRIPKINLKDLVLTDYSHGMLENTKKSTDGLFNIEPTFKVVDVQNIPFEDNSFDIVIANHMLYHVPDIQKGINEIYRVLDQGTLYAATNGSKHMLELYQYLKEFDTNFDDSMYKNLHFILDDAEGLLKSFQSIKILHYSDSLHVTNVKDLVDYELSMAGTKGMNYSEKEL